MHIFSKVYNTQTIKYQQILLMNIKKQEIIQTAIRLFSENWFHATGVDMIVRESWITKKTLYHHFGSKNGLIVASLWKYHGDFVEFLSSSVAESSDDPLKQLQAIFDVAYSRFRQDNFCGCMFINAIWEYSDSESEITEVSQNFKHTIYNAIKEICIKASLKNPDETARHIALLLEWAIVTAQVMWDPNAAETAKDILKTLIHEQQSQTR